MKYVYGARDYKSLERGEENCYLMTNGLGGFSALTMIGSASRNDHALLMSCSAEEAPNHRYNMIHRLEEILTIGERQIHLSSQDFLDKTKREEGYRYLSFFSYEDFPIWHFETDGVAITKKVVLMPGENTIGISYEIENASDCEISLRVIPHLVFRPKGEKLTESADFSFSDGLIESDDRKLYFTGNASVKEEPLRFCTDLYYAYDACDGREESGCSACNHSFTFHVEKGKNCFGEMIYGTANVSGKTFTEIEKQLVAYRNGIRDKAGFQNETAGMLSVAAEQFVAYRASTGKQTLLAGYPFFEDWGRDTMISVVGCCISTGQYKVAKSILETFMVYCKDGLMPNLFPEGKQEPRYNTVDAALLFILAVYYYYLRTKETEFVRSTWDVMESIVKHYMAGTDYAIKMDEDGLICAGQEYDQVTWMDVRVGDILPTPRHGKPVEINAYWYNALCILDYFQHELEGDKGDLGSFYSDLAKKVKTSFCEKFWRKEQGCLRDVLSGTGADEQIRCNQIWAVALPFSVLEKEQEEKVVETVYRRLYTPLGLRTLDMQDPQFHPTYGGALLERDLAYHQGTVWVFPLGAYYLAYLKVHDYSEAAKNRVRKQLEALEASLREGCIGQLPEIYDGARPVCSKGCFAQAWSVAEILRVYAALEE